MKKITLYLLYLVLMSCLTYVVIDFSKNPPLTYYVFAYNKEGLAGFGYAWYPTHGYPSPIDLEIIINKIKLERNFDNVVILNWR